MGAACRELEERVGDPDERFLWGVSRFGGDGKSGGITDSCRHDDVAADVFDYDELKCVENVVGVDEEVRRL